MIAEKRQLFFPLFFLLRYRYPQTRMTCVTLLTAVNMHQSYSLKLQLSCAYLQASTRSVAAPILALDRRLNRS